jgi:hypothetical protein
LTESVPAAYSKSIKAFISMIQSSLFRFCTPSHCRRGLWLRQADWRCASAPAAPTALASAAALLRRPRWPPQQCSTLLPNRRSVGKTSALDGHLHQRSGLFQHGPLAPTVLTIHRAAMGLSWSRMCCGDVDVATKIGDRR